MLALIIEFLKDLPIISGAISAIVGAFKKTPGQKADQPISDAHNAVQKAEATGDTSDIEKAISG